MVTRYIESRGRVRNLSANIMADVMRHLQARQHLGKAIVLCDDPDLMMPVAHKQWLKLSRTLQRRRGFTSNAIEILKYTYTITQMQHLNLVAQAPEEEPEATAYLVRPRQSFMVPANCFSLYLTVELPDKELARLVGALPASALVIDYLGQVTPGDFGLKSRAELENRVAASWQMVEAFLAKHQIDARRLPDHAGSPAATSTMDDALDTLLDMEVEFLGIASSFARTLDLARPLQSISKFQRDQYEAFVLLAHRVQALGPSGFSTQFLQTYGDDAFFLHDVRLRHESLAEAVRRHREAGRVRLAQALLQFSAQERRGVSAGYPVMGAAI